jgi:hypothetical protein
VADHLLGEGSFDPRQPADNAMNGLAFFNGLDRSFFLQEKFMKTKAVLELADVKAIAAAAEAEALKNQWAVTIAIVDDGGHLLWLQRLDGARRLISRTSRRPRPTPPPWAAREQGLRGCDQPGPHLVPQRPCWCRACSKAACPS